MCRFSAVFLFALAAWGQALPPGVQQKASVGGIKEYRRCINPAQISFVKAGDFKKAGVWQ